MNFTRKQGSETTLKKTWIFLNKLLFQFVYSNPFNVLDEGKNWSKFSNLSTHCLSLYAAVNGYLELSLLKEGRRKFSTSNLEVYKFWESFIGGIKGDGGICPLPQSEALPPPPLPTPPRRKNCQNQSFSANFWIFAPLRIAFCPLDASPHKKFLVPPHWIRDQSSPYLCLT